MSFYAGKPGLDVTLGKMRGVLRPGAGIDISAGTISTTGEAGVPYVGGTGIYIHGATISEDLTGLGRVEINAGTISYNPVADIINVTGSTVTLEPDKAYKIVTTNGAVNISANPPAANKWGHEGHAEIFVGATGYAVFDTSKIVLANQLEPDSVNNCTLRFHDGMCYVSVEDLIAGYIVVSATGTTQGTLPYGITSATSNYIAFDATTNGATVSLSGSTANGEKHLVGNGYTSTTLTGAVDCGTSKFTVANLGLNNVQVTGGTMTLGDAFIPSGSTVAVSGGGLAVEKVTGNGGVIDLGGTNIKNSGTPLFASGVSFTGGLADRGGAIRATGKVDLVDCVISGNTCTEGGAAVFIYYANNIAVNLTGCTVTGNTGTNTLSVVGTSAGYNLSSCHIGENQDIRLVSATDYTTFAGSNTFLAKFSGSGTVTLTSGAILDLTGNSNPTPINPGGGITFESGGATVKVGSGTASSSYMLDNVELPAGAKLTNTAVVDLGGTNIVNPVTMSMSGVTISGGSTSVVGGGVYNSRGVATITSCSFIGNSATNGGCGAYDITHANQTVYSACVFSVNSGGSGGGAAVNEANVLYKDCIFSGNSTTTSGGGLYATGSRTVEANGCVISGNSADRGGGVLAAGTDVRISNSLVSGNSDAIGEYDVRVNGGTCTLFGSTIGNIYHFAGSTVIKGNNQIASTTGSGLVVISNGASINLGSSMTCLTTGGITVLEGGCTVNGNPIAAGTYTSIDSNGQPT